MSSSINGMNRVISTGRGINIPNRGLDSDNNDSFNSIYNNFIKETQSVKFSKHAETRISQRNIPITNKDIKKIDDAINMARVKGVKDSLIFMKDTDTIFIANVPNKTIVTALDKEHIKENVFTNIDGAIII